MKTHVTSETFQMSILLEAHTKSLIVISQPFYKKKITITASRLCFGSDSSFQISSSLRADNSPSECYLLQDEVTLIAHTCNPHPYKCIYRLIYSISEGTTPLLSTSSSFSADEKQSSAACRWKCHTNWYLHFSHYHNPHDGRMRSHSVAPGHFEVSEVAFLTSLCIFSSLPHHQSRAIVFARLIPSFFD